MSKVVRSKSITGGTNLSTAKHLSIVLHGAANLNPLSHGTCNPYVVFTAGNEAVRSKPTEKSVKPNFKDQQFQILVRTGNEDLHIKVLDWDKYTQQDLIGDCCICPRLLPKGTPVRKSIPLDDHKGQVEITITAMNFGASAEEYNKEAAIVLPAKKHYEVNTSLGEEGAKQAKLADSNVAGIGSSLDIAQRVAAAKKAHEWKGVGQQEGTQVWRIEKFNVVAVPEQMYGHFYNGDSYIVLHTWKSKSTNTLKWDVHFWLGQSSSQDEQGVAAYKTVELDDLLGRAPVQHRETQGTESDLFLSYFKSFLILDGGVDSGFHHVEAEKYEPKLLHIKGKHVVRVREVPLTGNSLNQGDAFVLDAGLTLYYWSGPSASHGEHYKAQLVLDALRSARNGKPKEVRLTAEGSEEFWKLIGGKPATIPAATPDEESVESHKAPSAAKVFKLSDNTGVLTFQSIAEGKVTKGLLESAKSDVLVIDVGNRIFVYVGSDASKNERQNAMLYAQKYIHDNNRDNVPISRVIQGAETSFFFKFIA